MSWCFKAVNIADWGKFILKNATIYNIILFCRNITRIEIEWKEILCLLTKFHIPPQDNRFILGFSMHSIDMNSIVSGVLNYLQTMLSNT